MQKILILSLLCLLSLKAIGQENKLQADTLLLVPAKYITYANEKIKLVGILTQRLIVKDTVIAILDRRLKKSQEESKSYKIDADTFKAQVLVVNTEKTIGEQQNQSLTVENKQLRKKNLVLKIGVIALSVLEIYTLAHSH